MDKISLLKDPHTECALLRNCFALPKVFYLMLAVDPCHHQGGIKRFDTSVRKTLWMSCWRSALWTTTSECSSQHYLCQLGDLT